MKFKEYLNESVITMDFDHNLKFEHGGSNMDTVKQYKKLQKDNTIYIVTTRDESAKSTKEIKDFLKKHHLTAKDILYTNGDDKKPTLDKLKSTWHFDDDHYELDRLKIKTTHTYNHKEFEKYMDMLDSGEI